MDVNQRIRGFQFPIDPDQGLSRQNKRAKVLVRPLHDANNQRRGNMVTLEGDLGQLKEWEPEINRAMTPDTDILVLRNFSGGSPKKESPRIDGKGGDDVVVGGQETGPGPIMFRETAAGYLPVGPDSSKPDDIVNVKGFTELVVAPYIDRPNQAASETTAKPADSKGWLGRLWGG